MKITKRLSAFLVALVMALSLFAVGASAWSAGEGIDVYWNGEKVGETVSYSTMEEHAKKYPAESYSNNQGVKTGYIYQLTNLLKAVNKNDDWKAAPAETKVVIADAKNTKPAELTKELLDEKRNTYQNGAILKEGVKPGFMLSDGEDFFRFVFGQNSASEETSSKWVKLNGSGNATVSITTPDAEPGDDEEQTDGIEVFWNDKSVGSVSYDEMVDGISQATKDYTYSTVNSAGTYDSFTCPIYPFTQLIEAVKKDADWESAPDNTKVLFKDSGYETDLTKATLTEKRYFFDNDGVQANDVKAGFKITKSSKGDYLQLVFGQKTKDEQTNGKFFKFKEPATLYINTPELQVVAPDGTSKGFFYNDLDVLWQKEGSKKYTYTGTNTYPTFSSEELWGPTLKGVLAAAGIDLDALSDNDVVRFDAVDGRGNSVTVKEIKRTRYAFPNGKSENDYKGTTEAQYKDKVEVPFILSLKNGKTNIRNAFGQVDPQEQHISYFIKWINKITVTKNGATEYTGLTPTLKDGSTYKKGDKLNFDLELPKGVYEGAIYYTVSTDGTEPADPTYADTMYNWAQNRTDDQDYLDPEKSKLYNIYEFTDAPKTIVKVKAYVSGYTEPKAMTLTYTNEDAVTHYDGVVKGPDGKWAYYKDDVLQKDYTGIKKNEYGWWRIEKGLVNFNATGIYKNEYGWWRVEDGKVNFDAQEIYKNEYGWWKTTDGKVTFKETGIFKNAYGWWRVEDSKVNFKANSIYKNDYGWWKTTGGKVTFKENGVFKNEYGTWYVEKSKVNFKYNGKVSYNGKVYKVTNGKAKLA